MSRARDYSFEAMVEVTGAQLEALTKDERGRINRALAQLRVLTPDDFVLSTQIFERARAWNEVYPEIALTPQALTGVWSSVEEKAKEIKRSQQRATNIAVAFGKCPRCDGHKMVWVTEDSVAPCPECNSRANADFWRSDGSHFTAARPT